MSLAIALKTIFLLLITSFVSASSFERPIGLGRAPIAVGVYHLGVVGDSLATGAVARPDLHFDYKVLLLRLGDFIWEAIMDFEPRLEDFPNPNQFGLSSPVESAQRLLPTWKEVKNGQATYGEVLLNFGLTTIDNEEYSFGYMVGRALGFKGNDIWIAAQDGKRIATLGLQVERLLGMNPRHLPKLILVSYTGNDMCSEEILKHDISDVVKNYRKTLYHELKKVLNFPPHPELTTLVFVAPVNILSVVTNEKILAKPVLRDGKWSMCLDQRQNSKHFFNSILTRMCPAVLKTKSTDEKRVAHLRSIYNGFVEVQRQLLAAISAPGFRLKFIAESSYIDFDQEDVANDCFHLSVKGQSKLAQTILRNLQWAQLE